MDDKDIQRPIIQKQCLSNTAKKNFLKQDPPFIFAAVGQGHQKYQQYWQWPLHPGDSRQVWTKGRDICCSRFHWHGACPLHINPCCMRCGSQGPKNPHVAVKIRPARPCRICESPDWCLRCMRMWISRQLWTTSPLMSDNPYGPCSSPNPFTFCGCMCCHHMSTLKHSTNILSVGW